MKNRLLLILLTLSIINSYNTTIFGASNPPNSPINKEDKHGYTPLILAAQKGKLSAIKQLIKAKANVNHQATDGFTALIYAARNGHDDSVKALLKAEAHVNMRNQHGITALRAASCTGHTAIVSKLIQNNADMDAYGEGRTPLMIAALNGHTGVVKELLKSKADISLKDSAGNTALDQLLINECAMKDFSRAYSNELKQLLTSHHQASDACEQNTTEQVKKTDNFEEMNSALIAASKTSNTPIINYLLKLDNVNVNSQRAIGGVTPLMIASHCGNHEQVDLFLKNGANMYLLEDDNFNAPLIAAQEGRREAIQKFLDHGFDINCQNNPRKLSLLMTACEHGHKKLVDYLLKLNANVHLVDNNNVNALMYASEKNNIEIIQKLITYGSPINSQNKSGNTALLIATAAKHSETIQLLLEEGADLTITLHNSQITPFSLAIVNNYTEAVHLFLNKGVSQKDIEKGYILAEHKGFTQIALLLKAHLPHEPEVPAHADQKVTCSGPGCDKEGSQKCGKCKIASYCSKECQTAHWKTGGHKAVCLSLAGKPSVASKQHEQNFQTVLTQASKPKETEDSSHMALLLAAQQEKKAQQEAEKSEKSKKLVSLLRDFNPENTIERAHLKRHIQDGYRLHGEDIKLYKTEYEKAESLLF
ncbi:MAG: ankyrin repeat domain-containing protein, partial [Candidatus Dependentiae bacterium]|nr:ankyrin repeat domain-containing protein [Candidatus Dependentiae bacterium]